jgi:RNA polymerase sigma-70 factor, ECF subfamily
MTAADEELFRRMKRDDARALKTLFERHYPALCGFAVSIVNNAETAEETVSDVFAELWLKRATIEIRTSVRQYLYGAVRNRSLNSLRSSGLRIDSFEGGDAEPADTEVAADQPLLFQELEQGIDALINRMPDRRRLIFRMSRIDGLSYQEIAGVLSLSIHTVQNQMVEAVKFLTRSSDHLR